MKKIGLRLGIFICFIALIIGALYIVSQSEGRGKAPFEVVLEYKDKLYSVVYLEEGPAYENYDLEREITKELLGPYLGQEKIRISPSKDEVFKVYAYKKCDLTEYEWVPRLIIEDTKGDFYHALIGSVFNETNQTAEEVLTVYGIHSSNDLVSVSNEQGTQITDHRFIESFYEGLLNQEAYGHNKMDEDVYQNTGISEEEIYKLYTKHADNYRDLKIKLRNGLVIHAGYTSHPFVEVDNGLYFKVDESWFELVNTWLGT